MMKRFLIISVLCTVLAFIIPVSVYYIELFYMSTNDTNKTPSSGELRVFFHEENIIKSMNMEEYLYGVVAAEMPASFETEALKAQAVAARSYTFYRLENPTDVHPDADVCTDSTHCKAYKTDAELISSWGENKDKYSKKILNAVNGTAGEIIKYNGEVAMAVFHSQAGGGKTESSKDVWGGDVPYLVSVESHGEETAPNFYSSLTLSFSDFKSKLSEKYPDISIESPLDMEITEINDGGSVKSVRIGNKILNGRDVRSIFNLRSSCFNLQSKEDSITFEVSGYGHGVGMSQYGANAMAKEGSNYVDILKHYYTGTEVDMV